jgi:formamidopyrimidine-DNA glycosylase
MPELPEVETTIRGLRRRVLGRTFVDVWTDWPKLIKKPKSFEKFKKEIKYKEIKKIWRRGKNILFDLSDDRTLLIHQKLTGHLLFGKWEKTNNRWQPPPGPLSEKINSFLHLLFTLDNGKMLALSDLRKFAKVELLNKEELKKELSSLGPEALEKSFTFKEFKKALQGKGRKIKQVLMEQKTIAGIGNIYSDEILFASKIHPRKKTSELKEKEMKEIYKNIKKILKKAISLKGESISDYRVLSGERGGFDTERKIYGREGERCLRCGSVIKRIKIGGRSAHFCPKCQKR